MKGSHQDPSVLVPQCEEEKRRKRGEKKEKKDGDRKEN